MPSTNTTPGQPTGVTAHLDDAGNIIVQCDPTPLATRYRWRGLLVGLETAYRLVASSTGAMGSITGVLPGQTLQIIVQAVNNGLQGVPSEPIQFTMPVMAKRTVTAEVAAPIVIDAAANGNGRASNGHTKVRLPALNT